MTSRTKVAAVTASVVPFHCIICFDEFSVDERPPVVLPCGHTFICAPCSKRLKRCMECREPLFITLPSGSKLASVGNSVRGVPPPPSMYTRPSGRHSPSPATPPQSSAPPAPPVQIPIPIPKNVVLIAMMEAAARQVKSTDDESNDIDSDGSMDDDEEEAYDLNNIISGMATLAGPCGTYSVRESGSLVVVPYHPNKRNQKDKDVQDDNDATPHVEPFPLMKGQTLQVVDFEDGFARLARGAGYVVGNSSHLVKVNGPLESNCRLEGLLDTVVRRSKDLQKELDESHRIEASLRKEIEIGIMKEPSHPVISVEPTISVADSFDRCETDCSSPGSTKNETGKDDHYCTPERTRSSEFLDVNYSSNGENFITRLNSIDNSDICVGPRLPSYRQMPDENLDYIYGCGAALLGNAHIFTSSVQGSHHRLDGSLIEDPVDESADSSRVRQRPARSTNPGLSSSPSASFDAVDFRTGLSGHRALNVTKTRVDLSPRQRNGVRLMMSQHTGLGRLRGPANRTNTNAPSH